MWALKSSTRLVVIFAVSVGCSPSVAGLVRDRHYDEAFAAATEMPEYRERVFRAALHDADPAIHVRVLSDDELAAQLGDAAPALSDVLVVRVHSTTNRAPLRARLYVSLHEGSSPLPTLDLSIPALAAKTGEAPRMTPHREASSGSAAEVWWVLANIVFVGVPALIDARFDGALRPEPRSTSDLEQTPTLDLTSVPRAARIHEAMSTTSRPDDPHVDRFIGWKRPSSPNAPLVLHVGVLLGAKDTSSSQELAAETTVRLPPAPSLDERFTAVFGANERRLVDLGSVTLRDP